MKLISWNVNGIRACLQKGFEDAFHTLNADFFCLQETKAQPLQVELDLPGYRQYWYSAEKKGYSGTAIFTRHEPLAVTYGVGVEELDHEGRLITLEYPNCFIATCYTPNAQDGLKRLDHRMAWDDAFRAYLVSLDRQKPVIVCGDLNVAHQEIDLKNPGPAPRASRTRSAASSPSCCRRVHGYVPLPQSRPHGRVFVVELPLPTRGRRTRAGASTIFFVSDRLRESVAAAPHLSGNLRLRPLSGRSGAGYGGICMKKQRIIRWLSALLCLCLLAGFAPAAMAYSNVSDWAKSEVAEMEALGLLPDCLLNADLSANITRGEMCKMAVEVYENLMNVEASCASGARYFTDTQEMEINFAFEQGIINGYEDQTFRPNEPLSRQDFFKITYNLMTRALFWKDESVEPSDLSQFTDAASVSDYALEPTQYMVALGVVRGTGTALEPKGHDGAAGGHRHVPPRVLHCQRVAAQK